MVNKDGEDPNPTKQDQYHTLVLSNADNENGVEIEAAVDDTEVVLISGEPLDQPVVQYGPFGKRSFVPEIVHPVGAPFTNEMEQ